MYILVSILIDGPQFDQMAEVLVAVFYFHSPVDLTEKCTLI